ncbi:MAG: Rrf2 family transcriptional regulator [Patescibacteria group bacterium]|nr:Rrf2 family transcriptional regulator [Patescibacteria group bacterium]
MAQLFRVPQRVHHGLLIATELASLHRGGGWLSLDEMARRTSISQGFLEQAVTPLRRAGLVDGRRGPQGGYRLAHAPRSVSVAAVIEAIEGPTSVAACTGASAHCGLASICSSRKIWSAVQASLDLTLRRLKLSDLAGGSCCGGHGKKKHEP